MSISRLSASAALDRTVIAARFELLEVAGRGGMGTVYRAHDLETGATVAIKMLNECVTDGADAAERFLREAHVLSQLQHRNIVRYVTHGIANPQGGTTQPFLAMEWLNGVSLADRIEKSPLSEDEALSLLRMVATTLATAHESGIVHRDLKPENLILREGRIDDPVLLDFGIARQEFHRGNVTRTGTVLGTPDYMAPEQARGEATVGPEVDIFSLGCVLYECLTGRSPFGAQHIAAVLAKILFGEPAPLRSILPSIRPEVEALIEKMLRKAPKERFSNAGALAEVLQNSMGLRSAFLQQQTLTSVMKRSEQQLVSVVVAVGADSGYRGQTLGMSRAKEIQLGQKALSETLRPFGREEWLADGSLVVLIETGGSAADQATQAARCALAVSERWPGSQVAVSTGRGVRDGDGFAGEALERAVQLLWSATPRQTLLTGASAPSADAAARPEEPRIDTLTAGLLRGRFAMAAHDGQVTLLSELGHEDETRMLLGKPTACVGRDQELGTLELVLSNCVEESSPRAVLVTAQPGIGKTRLRREFLRRATVRHNDLRVLLGQTDPLSAQAPYSLFGRVVRRAAGICEGEPLPAQRERLRELVRTDQLRSDPQTVAAFLGELASVPFDDTECVALHAARQNPELLGKGTVRAIGDWIGGMAVGGPVLLVLEDLHWSDPQSVALLRAVLRDLRDIPLCVLALARPEVSCTFASLDEIFSQRIDLRGLSKRAGMRLVQQVLGLQADTAMANRIVEQAQGNALFLEELIRTLSEGKGDQLPETVMAMLQVRISRLDIAARRALRAASVFGESFWRGGLAALLDEQPEQIESVLRRLVSLELVESRRDSRFPGETEYVFHHALLREAAYGLMSEEERVVGHRLAGDYLERVGELEPLVLASHFERGAELTRAGGCYLRASEKAHRGSDRDGTLSCAQRALACGLQGEQQVKLLGLLCEAHAWYAEWEIARGYAQTVMRLSPPSSGPWARAAVARFGHALEPERLADFHEVYQTLAQNPPAEESLAAVGFVLMAALYILVTAGEFEIAKESLRLLAALVEQYPQHVMLRAWHQFTSAVYKAWQARELPVAQQQAAMARDLFREAGFQRGALLAQVIFGLSSWQLGDHDAAERELHATLAGAPQLGPLTSLRSLVLCQVLCERGALDEAEELATSMCAAGQAQRLPPDEGRGLWALAEIRLRRGDYIDAEEAVRAALPLLKLMRPEQLAAEATLTEILLRQGRSREALDITQQDRARDLAAGNGQLLRARMMLIEAEALRACGEGAASQRALFAARSWVLDVASDMKDEGVRKRYVSCSPGAAQILSRCELLIQSGA